MSAYVFPTLPNLAVDPEVEHIGGRTILYENPGGTEQRVALMSIPRERFTLKYAALRDNVAAPAPWTPYSELGVVLWFADKHSGAWDSFLFDHPFRGRKNLVAYSQDFSQAIWEAYYLKPAMTGGFAAPDGTLTAQQFASADYAGNNISGVTQINAAAPAGPIVVSAWARVTAGTLPVYIGTGDGYTANPTLSTSWQRISFYDAAWSPARQGGRIFQLYEGTASNAAWQVWGAQAEVGITQRLYVPTKAAPAGYQVRVRFEEDSLVIRRVNDEWYSAEFALVSVAA